MNSYEITNSRYTAEYIGMAIEGLYQSEERIDCTQFMPDVDGSPIPIPAPPPPPITPVETIAQKKARLIAANLTSYNADIETLKSQLVVVLLNDGTNEASNLDAIKADFATRKSDYLAARAAILALTS